MSKSLTLLSTISYGNVLQPRDDHSAVNRERCSSPFAFPEKIGVKFVQTLGWPMHGGDVSMYPKES